MYVHELIFHPIGHETGVFGRVRWWDYWRDYRQYDSLLWNV